MWRRLHPGEHYEGSGEDFPRGRSEGRLKKQNLGKVAEKAVQGWLEKTSASRRDFAFHRYPDARAARGALAAQPSDFLVAYKKLGVFHLEVKETEQQYRLPKAKITQFGKLMMFWWAGIEPVVVVYRSAHSDWTYFRAADLFPASDEVEVPKSFPFIRDRSFASVNDCLSTIFFN